MDPIHTFALVALLLQAAPPSAPPAATSQAPAAPEQPAVTFASSVGLLLVAVKPDRTADYEAAIVALQQALATDGSEARRAQASGWRVYKAAEADAKGNVLYVHAVTPAVPGADYRPSKLLDDLLKGAPADLLAKYRDAFAAPPTRLSLSELAHMAVAPVKK